MPLLNIFELHINIATFEALKYIKMKLIINILNFSVILFSFNLWSQTQRPQEPKEPFNYISEDVTFINFTADSILLSGTLTLPKDIKNPPVAILISGSGPQDRNEEILGHKPFLVISHYLTNHGIGVFRYDDRGVGESKGDFTTATTFDFTTDVEAAIDYLKSRNHVDSSKIGLIGHSEGGIIAPMVASKNKNVAFAVLLGGTGVNGAEILLSQSRKAGELAGTSKDFLDENEKLASIIYDIIRANTEEEILKTNITNALNDYKTNNPQSPLTPHITPMMIAQQLSVLKSDWLCNFIRIEPKDYLEKTTCPVLALNGSKDIQVLPDINLEGIKKGLANNKDVTIKKLEGLNHLFQNAETGNVQEYANIEETFAPIALEIIKDWILERF